MSQNSFSIVYIYSIYVMLYLYTMYDIDTEKKFEKLYKLLLPEVFKYIYFRTKDKNIANDLTQNIFIKVYEKIETIRAATEKTYIFTIVKNQLIDYYRTKKNIVSYEETFPDHDPLGYTGDLSQEIITENDRMFIVESLDRLSEDYKDIIIKKALLGWSYEEISEETQESEQTLRKRYSRALIQLAKVIKEINLYE